MNREVMPRVSVGVPTFNCADTLPRTIESVLGQTFADFELIVSDNASEDSTEELCRRYTVSDRRIRYSRQPTTLSALENFRFVLEQARAPYFMWLAADDYLLPPMLDRAVEVLDARPEVVCAVPRTELVAADGTRHAARGTFPLLDDPAQNLCRFLVDPSDNSRLFGLYRRDVICHLVPSHTYYAADWAMAAATLRYGKHVELPEVLLVREVGDPVKYYRTVDELAGGPLDRVFPLAPFTRAVLGRFAVSRRPGVLYALLRINVIHHLQYSQYRYPRYGRIACRVSAGVERLVSGVERLVTRTGRMLKG